MKRVLLPVIAIVSIALAIVSCQKAPFITLNTPKSFTFTKDGGTQSITFTCNRDWSVSSSESWIRISPSSGTATDGEITVSIVCAENTTYDARTATVTVKVEELTETISISQDTGLGLIVSPSSFDLTNAAQTIEIEVQKNVQYNISIDPTAREWITLTGTKGLTSEKLTFSIAANETYENREGVITFKQSGGPLFDFVVIKQSQQNGLFVSPETFELNFEAQVVEVETKYNVEYEISIPDSADWISLVEGTKALTTSKTRFSIQANDTFEAREATITFKQKNGGLSASILVKQAGKVPVESIVLNTVSLKLVEGTTETLVATVKPDNATDKTVTWSSSNTSIATVNENGVVTAVKEGTATVIATAGDKSAQCSITVNRVAPKAKLSLIVEAGKLKETIEALGIDILNVQELTVSGELNGNDLAVIRTMAGNDKYFIQEDYTPSDGCLEVLDMKGSVLIPGSEIYMYQYGQNYSINNYNEIPHDAFRACIRLKKVVLPDKCTLASGFSFFSCYALESVVLPSSVKTVPRNCFAACRSLKQVSIPDVTTINEYAFNGCVSLTSVELGAIQKFGSAVFERCTALTSISIPSTNQFFCIDNKAVLSKDKTILYYYPGGLSGIYTTPSTVEQIAPWAFCDSNLEALNVAYGVRVIGDYAFYNSNFESLTIANSVTDIGGGWFNNPRLNHLELPGSVKVLLAEIQNCPALKEVVIPDGMTTIYYAFGQCSNLQKITLPESLTHIDKRSFGGTAVKEVHCKSSTPTKYDKYPFASDAIVYVPKGAKGAYMADKNWNVYSIMEE